LVLCTPLHKMLDKADRLLKAGRIERLESGHFNVIGDHGTYTLVVRNGRVYCSCPGFQEKGVCSHSLAVLKLTQTSNDRY
jgi:predicted nucleic acid-binding Zn finger protein